MFGSSRTTSSDGRPLGRYRGLFLWAVALAALAPLVADCGGGGGDDDDSGVRPGSNPCDSVYQGKCGATCATDDACPAGLFCGNGACTAQCSSEGGCASGQSCSVKGRCVGQGTGGTGPGGPPITQGSGGAGGGASGAGGGGTCAEVAAKFQPIIPAVMIVVDRSASMECPIDSPADVIDECGNQADPNSPGSRWQTFKGPLLELVQEQQEKVIFGITFYPEGNNCGVEASSTVTLRAGASDEIVAKYNLEVPGGSTPTGAAIDSAANQIRAVTDLPPGTPRFILLASDGSPRCGQGSENAQQTAARQAIEGAFGDGIRTFVLAIGALFDEDVAPDKLAQFQQLANAGAGVAAGQPDAPLFLASNGAALTAELTKIINGVRPCSFDLDKALADPTVDGPRGTVTIDGQQVDFDGTNGWQLTDADTVQFFGTACTAVQSSTDVKAVFPCGVATDPAPPPPPR